MCENLKNPVLLQKRISSNIIVILHLFVYFCIYLFINLLIHLFIHLFICSLFSASYSLLCYFYLQHLVTFSHLNNSCLVGVYQLFLSVLLIQQSFLPVCQQFLLVSTRIFRCDGFVVFISTYDFISHFLKKYMNFSTVYFYVVRPLNQDFRRVLYNIYHYFIQS